MIADKVRTSHSMIIRHIDLLDLSSTIINNATQRDMIAEMRRDRSETRDLLLAMLSARDDRQQIIALQLQGEHVAEEVMAAGQEVRTTSLQAFSGLL